MPHLNMTYVLCVLLLVASIVMIFLGYWKRGVPVGLAAVLLIYIMYRADKKGK